MFYMPSKGGSLGNVGSDRDFLGSLARFHVNDVSLVTEPKRVNRKITWKMKWKLWLNKDVCAFWMDILIS